VALMHPESPGAGCADCQPLRLTDAKLGTMRLDTAQGPAAVPAWVFSVAASRVRVVHPAVAPTAGVDVLPRPLPGGIGLSVESFTASPDGRTLTVTFVGAPRPASEPCGADYTATAVESSHAVVVVVDEHVAPGDQACSSIGARRTATAPLTAPLAGRAVLEVRQGMPVPVTRS